MKVFKKEIITPRIIYQWMAQEVISSLTYQDSSYKEPLLTQKNKDDLERTQKSFAKMVLKDKYINYENAKIILNLDSLQERRQILCLKFAKNGIKTII